MIALLIHPDGIDDEIVRRPVPGDRPSPIPEPQRRSVMMHECDP